MRKTGSSPRGGRRTVPKRRPSTKPRKAKVRTKSAELPGRTHAGDAVDDRRRTNRRGSGVRKQQAASLSQEDYSAALPGWFTSARAIPTGTTNDERERNRVRAYELVDRLLQLRPPTNDPTGTLTETNEALRVAGELFSLLAWWAVWHRIGDAARQAGVKLGPTQLWTAAPAERLLPSDGKVILHQLDAILQIFHSCFPLAGCAVIRDQIRALLAGEVSVVFRPQRQRRHGTEGYRLWVMRARAIGHVEYLVKSGKATAEARKAVADAYGQAAPENIKTWERRVSAIIGKDLVDWMLETAREEAEKALPIRAFGEPQLREDGEKYQQLAHGKEPLGADKARGTVLVRRSPDRPGVSIELHGPQASGDTTE